MEVHMLDSQNSITQYRKKMPVTESHNDVAYSQLEKSFPVQLELFQAHRYLRAKKTDYSRSIAVYDQLPKHHHGRQHHLRQVTHNGLREVLPDIVREPCVIGGIAYNLRIRPARVDVLTQTDGETKRVTRDIYPGPREELVEEVIRKLSLQEGNISYVRLGGMQAVAVTFTLSDIESELSQNGHTYSRAEIKEALHVCRNCELNVTWTDQNGKRMDHSAPIFLQAVLGGDNDSHHVVFHPFVTDSIDQISWRITNY